MRIDEKTLDRIYKNGDPDAPEAGSTKWTLALMTVGLIMALIPRLGGGDSTLLILVISFLSVSMLLRPNSSEDSADKDEHSADFQRNGLHLCILRENQPIWQQNIQLKKIASVAPYHQQGWIFSRDHGVVIEDHDGQQWRLAFSLSRQELDAFAQTLRDSLEPLSYPVGNLRRFQP